jgi:Asp-tRNA(Asn)/Glu-tRNA(Gln) amidotransferase B subunit
MTETINTDLKNNIDSTVSEIKNIILEGQNYIKEWTKISDRPEYEFWEEFIRRCKIKDQEEERRQKEFNILLSHFMIDFLLPELKHRNITIEQSPVSPKDMQDLTVMAYIGSITQQTAKYVLKEMFSIIENTSEEKTEYIEYYFKGNIEEWRKCLVVEIIQNKGLWAYLQENNKDEIDRWINQVIEENSVTAAEFAAGKDKAIGVLVGKIMKLSNNKANAKIINEILTKKLRG